jgi:tetratricopeptide (TPR) repeat protein
MFRCKLSATIAAVVFVASMGRGVPASAGSSDMNEVCDPTADYLLGIEDYPRSIEAHLRLIAVHPDDALAHYHLGFAYGMVGRHRDELAEYLDAVALGLKQWDLFLNLGRLYLEHGEFHAATAAFTTAVILGPDHAEAHFNLALADERRGALGLAYDEIQTSLRLDADQPDARNMLGVVCAEQGKIGEARRIWADLAASEPDFAPARTNLALIEHLGQPPHGAPSKPSSAFLTASLDNPH